MNNPFSFGALESKFDNRTISYEPTLAALFTQGGVDYLPTDIENQHTVGICTAISLTQERGKSNKKKYSADFQYLLQKKFYDLNWAEGSSILNALKVGKKYGFLPTDKWTHTTEADRNLTYMDYILKLQSIPDTEIQRLLGLCVDKILGYSQIDVNSPVAIARAIGESGAGIICRFQVGKEWWTPSWLPKDINPLRPPVQVISGHAIVMSKFDYNFTTEQSLANTWGAQWNKEGTGEVIWDNYRPTESWIIVNKIYFLKDLKLGMTDPDVKLLQQFLNSHGYAVAQSGAGSLGNETEYFGSLTQKALIKFQIANNIQPSVGYFGIITRTRVNSIA
jgi:Putative peptidoglycan binding domain